MAILKHIAVKNRYYSMALEYLTCQFDEKTMQPVLDEKGRIMERENYLLEGVHCDVDSFGYECLQVNKQYGKNNDVKDIKAHHYIISFSPDDNITMEEAMAFGREWTEEFAQGHQAVLCVHPDGHNGSGNIHVHIVMNSVRKYGTDIKEWHEKPCEYKQGCKHKCSGKMMRHAKQWVMDECLARGYSQVDLFSKKGRNDYWVEKRGKEKNPDFVPDKEQIRHRLDELIMEAESLEQLVNYLECVEDWNIRTTEKTISFRMPDMKRAVRGKTLGAEYDKARLEDRIEVARLAREEAKRKSDEEIERITERAIKIAQKKAEEKKAREKEWYQEISEQLKKMNAILDKSQILEEMITDNKEELIDHAVNDKRGEAIESVAENPVLMEMPDMEAIEQLLSLEAEMITLQYEYEVTIKRISDLDYDQRHHIPQYNTYCRIHKEIEQLTGRVNLLEQKKKACSAFQRKQKQEYQEEIIYNENRIETLRQENNDLLYRQGCMDGSDLFQKQQRYQMEGKELDICIGRNKQNRKRMEEVLSTINHQRLALDEVTRDKLNEMVEDDGFGKRKENMAEEQLREMYGEDFIPTLFIGAICGSERKLDDSMEHAKKDRERGEVGIYGRGR